MKACKSLLALACLAVVSAHAGVLVSAWEATPITLGNLTFTFVESSGFAKSAVSVEVSQVGLNYALTFTGLSGNVAGIEDPPSPDGTELRYTVQVTSGSAVFDAVGLQVAATPAVSTKTSWYSGCFHMDAALPQTLANSGSVAGIDVDGS